MNIIVAADRNWGIGRNGQLLVRIPYDQKLFRQETAGKVVVYGRRTLATFLDGRPLAGRENIILTGRESFSVKGARTAGSLEALMALLEPYDTKDVYVAGGAMTYRQLLPYCDVAHVTRIDHAYDADAYFPDLDADPGWTITDRSDEQYYFDLPYYFLRYVRRLP